MFLLKVIREEWEKYLLSKVELQALPKFNKKKPKAPKGFGILNGVISSVSGQKADVSSISKQENDALLAAALEISKLVKGNKDIRDGGTNEEHGKERTSERKKKKSVIGKSDPISDTSIQSKIPTSKHEGTRNEQRLSVSGHPFENASGSEYLDGRILRKHDQGSGIQLSSVYFHALESDKNILDILQPSVIILYHPNIAFVREIEVYKSENPSKRLKVYFLFYENSTEVQKFEASIRKENGAFESLIRQKSLMMVPVNQVFLEAHFYLLPDLLSVKYVTCFSFCSVLLSVFICCACQDPKFHLFLLLCSNF